MSRLSVLMPLVTSEGSGGTEKCENLDQSLDQNLWHPLSEKGAYSPDVQHESTGTGCCSNVGSEGELTIECHTQVPSSPVGLGYHSVFDYCLVLVHLFLICFTCGLLSLPPLCVESLCFSLSGWLLRWVFSVVLLLCFLLSVLSVLYHLSSFAVLLHVRQFYVYIYIYTLLAVYLVCLYLDPAHQISKYN